MIQQRHWRIVGALALVGSASMAVYSAPSGILHDSILRFVSLVSEKVVVESPTRAGWVLLLYWSAFCGLIGVSLYCAAIDIRYIRLQYQIEKREILKRTVEEKAFREALNLGTKKKD